MMTLFSSFGFPCPKEIMAKSPVAKVHLNDPDNMWSFISTSITDRLPLTDVEWNNRLLGTTVVIPELKVEFVTERRYDQPPPFLWIYVVKCEELDAYKRLKVRLQEWVDKKTQDFCEWLILYVPIGTNVKDDKIYKKVFEKLTSEFKNVLQVQVGGAFGMQQEREVQWLAILSELKAGIMRKFEARCEAFESQIISYENMRESPEFDFGAFFGLKENLAKIYQDSKLYVDALRHYDELEAIFSTFDNSLSGIGIKPVTEFDKALNCFVLDLDLSAIKDGILKHTVTSIDVRLYVFARQLAIILEIRNGKDILERTEAFVSSCVTLLSSFQNVSRLDALCWAIKNYVAVISLCESKIPQSSIEIGRLLDQLKFYVKSAMELVVVVPMTSDESCSMLLRDRGPEFLLQVLQLCVSHFKRGGMKRYAAKIQGDCASLFISSGQYAKALEELQHQLVVYQQDTWHDLTSNVLEKILTCKKELREDEGGVVETTLKLLEMNNLPLSRKVELLHALKDNCKTNFEAPMLPHIYVGMKQDDGVLLQLYSNFPEEVLLSSIYLSFDLDGDKMKVVSALQLMPGLNEIPLNQKSFPGSPSYRLHNVSVELFEYLTMSLNVKDSRGNYHQQLCNDWDFENTSDLKRRIEFVNVPEFLVPFREYALCLRVSSSDMTEFELRLPPGIELASQRSNVEYHGAGVTEWVKQSEQCYKTAVLLEPTPIEEGFCILISVRACQSDAGGDNNTIKVLSGHEEVHFDLVIKPVITSKVNVYHIEEEDQVVLSISVQSNSSIWIRNSALVLPRQLVGEKEVSAELVEDPNEVLDDFLMAENSTLNLAYVLQAQENSSGVYTDGSLSLHYSFEKEDLKDFVYEIPVTLCASTHKFRVSLGLSKECASWRQVIGVFITCELVVTCVTAESSSSQYQYIISGGDDWVVSGKQKRTFSFTDSSFSDTVQLLPIRTGLLCLPKVQLAMLEDDTTSSNILEDTYVDQRHNGVQISVFPPNTLTCGMSEFEKNPAP